ncbi:MAG: helix-turn-helix domain-containing protein, partial [Oscillospiraceae bacterium]|nr:helix-turn-helix domain-containing protein [Oscillospiraceae bacterium]
MSVMRVHKNKDYTVVSNVHLRDKRISLKAKGLLTLMLSLPEDWDYSIAGLAAICKEGKDAIQTTLSELEQFHYL